MTDTRQMMAAAAAAHRAGAAEHSAHYRELSRGRLKAAVGRKGRTVIFGLVERFERAFGLLWGHGKPDAACTPEELAWRDAWARLRTDCLDHGHAQLRALDKELAEYEVEWLRHRRSLPVAPDAGGGSIPGTNEDEKDQQ
jgi:hypothetical protein